MPARPAPGAPAAPASLLLTLQAQTHPHDSQLPPRGVGVPPAFPPAPAPVVRATPADLAYVVALQKRNHEALGFIPRAALAQKIDLSRIWLATENGDPAGYLHHGSLAVPEVRIFQAAVQYDARRRHLGLALVADLLSRARAAGAGGVSLRCLDFLDANDFWTAAGFHLIAREPGARGTLNAWGVVLSREEGDKGTRRQGDKGTAEGEEGDREPRGRGDKKTAERETAPPLSLSPCPHVPLSLLPPPPFPFHSRIHPCPRCGAPTTDTWTRGAVRRRVCPRCVTLTGHKT